MHKLLIPFFLAFCASCFGQPLSCNGNGGITPPVRVEGLTELVGDFLIGCTGGTPTPSGVPIPTTNIQIFLNAPVTSRCLGSATSTDCIGLHSEALLILDEPTPATQYGCPTNTCTNIGTGAGAGGYGSGISGTLGNNKNVFQGIQTSANSITFPGIPLDPPGNSSARVFRITNVRVNASLIGLATVGSNLPNFVIATIVSDSIPIFGATQALAYLKSGMYSSVAGGNFFQQNSPQNWTLAADPNSSGVSQFNLLFFEDPSTVFRKRNIGTRAADPAASAPQDDLTVTAYNTESGFYKSSLTLPSSLVPPGLADTGTRFLARFTDIPSGVSLFSAVSATVTDGSDVVRMVNADVNGAGPYSPVTGNAFGIAPIPVVNGAATAVYEVVESDSTTSATVSVPIYVAFTSNVPANMPGIGTAKVKLSYAPVSTVTSAVAANVPRFSDLSPAGNAFFIDAPPCATLVGATVSFSASGGPGSAAVTADAACIWAPFSAYDWITVSPAGSYSGSGTLNYSVAPNPYTFQRTGYISLAFGQPLAQTLTITQPGVTCSYSAGPITKSAPWPVSYGSINVTANFDSCSWTASSQSAWITLSATLGFGSHSVFYSLEANPGSPRTGTVTVAGQTITIAQQTQGQSIPAPVFQEPSSGSGSANFLFGFSDPDGWEDLKILNVLINSALDGRNACYVAVVPTGEFGGTVLLVGDAGDAGGPFQTLPIPSSGTIGNSQCTIHGTNSALGSGTLYLDIAFSPGFAGNKVVYTAARDLAQHNSGWQSRGVWNVPGPASSGPTATGVGPARTDYTMIYPPTSQFRPYTFTFADSNGFLDLTILNVLINTAVDGRSACYIAYVPSGPTTGTVLLVNDAGNASGPFQTLTIPGPGTIENSQCTIRGAGSSATGSGNTRTLTLPIGFRPGFTGNQVVYAAGRSSTLTSGWQALGSVTVP